MLSILVIVLVVLLLIADTLIFFTVGYCFNAKKIVMALKEKGWTIEPPEDGANG